MINFNTNQLSIIDQLNLSQDVSVVVSLFNEQDVSQLSLNNLLTVLETANSLYRSGHPVIDDQVYDTVYLQELKNREPKHPFLNTVEPEVVIDSKTVALPQKMLSTDKAYSFEEIRKWIERLIKAAGELGIDNSKIDIRVTPKLDGYAAFDDGSNLYTRGDGNRGQDITRAFNRGLKVAEQGDRGQGPGEIVIKKSYFDSVLSDSFENSRNIQAAIIAEKKVDKAVQTAIDAGACVFYPFSLITNWTGHYSEVLSDFEAIVERIWNGVD